MRSLLFLFLIFPHVHSVFAQTTLPHYEEAQIYSIEDDDTPQNYVEVSEEALPSVLKEELMRETSTSSFTSISSSRANQLFSELKNDRRARMNRPAGACSTRRVYVQNYLRKKNIRSGKFYISCPGNNGRLRLRDRVSGRYFTYSNFHDTNVVLVGKSYRIMDIQFESGPVTLGSYLAEIESHQRIKPAKEMDAGTCYWRISSPALTKDLGGPLSFVE